MRSAYVIDAVRTPRGAGKPGGGLSSVHPIALLAGVLRALRERNGLDPAAVSEAIIGCVTQTGDQGGNIARAATLSAGWSDQIAAITVNNLCASSLTAATLAAARIAQGEDLVVAGGVESMSRVPMAADQPPFIVDAAVVRQLSALPIGIAADVIATRAGYTREQVDAYAVQSQQRAAAARRSGFFARSLLAVQDAQGRPLLAQDETIRENANIEKLLTMTPYFAEMGRQWADAMALQACPELGAVTHFHHAGNSPAMADGASAILLASETGAKRLGLKPRARLLAQAQCSGNRSMALLGAVESTQLALARAGLKAADIDLYEVNEAFAAPAIHYAQTLGISQERMNVNGGAIALGHAMGATGTNLIGTALDELERRGARYAVIAVSGALGLGAAAIIERVPVS